MLHEFHVIGIGAIVSVVALLWRDRRDQDNLFGRVPAPSAATPGAAGGYGHHPNGDVVGLGVAATTPVRHRGWRQATRCHGVPPPDCVPGPFSGGSVWVSGGGQHVLADEEGDEGREVVRPVQLSWPGLLSWPA